MLGRYTTPPAQSIVLERDYLRKVDRRDSVKNSRQLDIFWHDSASPPGYGTSGTISTSERSTSSGDWPLASASKVSISRCRSAGKSTARVSESDTLSRPSSSAEIF